MVTQSAVTYSDSSWNTVYETVFAEPYISLPQYRLDSSLFGAKDNTEDNNLLMAAKRTLSVNADLYDFPQGQKLLQANGICFSGLWVIDRESEYTGMFAYRSRFPIIARASVSLNGTKFRDKRAFAMAVKIFPTRVRNQVVETRNVFVMDTIAGKRRQYFLDTNFDNAPSFGGLPTFSEWGLALRLKKDLTAADRELSPAGPNIAFRPINHLAEPLDPTSATVISPKWLRLTIANETQVNQADDFRDEIALKSFPDNRLIWDIAVANNHVSSKSYAEWKIIGQLTFTESIVSLPCDNQLHFGHPVLNN